MQRARIRLAERNGAQINPNDTAALQVINTVSKRGRKQGTYYSRKADNDDLPAMMHQQQQHQQMRQDLAAPSSGAKRGLPKYKPTPSILMNAATMQQQHQQQQDLIPTPPNMYAHHPPQDPSHGSPYASHAQIFSPTGPNPLSMPPAPQQHQQHHSPPRMHSIPIDTLLWGSWRRTLTPLTQTIDPIPDLQMHMDTLHRQLYITITSQGGQFRIEIPFDTVTTISVEDRHYANDGSGQQVAGQPQQQQLPGADLIVTAVTFGLNATAPRFYMQLPPALEWLQCSDFTENAQGTSVPIFTVLAGGGVDGIGTGGTGGGYESELLKQALAEVVTADKWLTKVVVNPDGIPGGHHAHHHPQQQQQQHVQHPYDNQQHGPPPQHHQQHHQPQHLHPQQYQHNPPPQQHYDEFRQSAPSVAYHQHAGPSQSLLEPVEHQQYPGLLSVAVDSLVGLQNQQAYQNMPLLSPSQPNVHLPQGVQQPVNGGGGGGGGGDGMYANQPDFVPTHGDVYHPNPYQQEQQHAPQQQQQQQHSHFYQQPPQSSPHLQQQLPPPPPAQPSLSAHQEYSRQDHEYQQQQHHQHQQQQHQQHHPLQDNLPPQHEQDPYSQHAQHAQQQQQQQYAQQPQQQQQQQHHSHAEHELLNALGLDPASSSSQQQQELEVPPGPAQQGYEDGLV
ncbi:hypothetical protein HDU98_001618 [Podochytrium sp. JEL0797]|nr:hypothetical protein HDU98_001618 [Podochytrium sp. JEL0797]